MHLRQAEHDRRVDKRQQVIDLEAEVVGQFGESLLAAPGGQDFQQARKPARRHLGQRRLGRGADRLACGRLRRDRVLGGLFAAGQDPVDGVDELLARRIMPVARAGQANGQLGADAPWVGGQHEDAVSELDGFLDVVGDDQDRLDRELFLLPQPGQLAAQVRRGEHVKGGKRLVHQQGVGLDGQRAGEADALAHAAGQLLRIGGLEAVQADQVDHGQRPFAALLLRHVAGLHRQLHVLLHGEPGQQGKALEDHGDARVRAVQRGAPVGNGACRGRDQAGDAAQQRRFARTGLAEQRDDLPLSQGERDAVKHRQGAPVGSGERLGHAANFDDHRAGAGGRGARSGGGGFGRHIAYLVSAT